MSRSYLIENFRYLSIEIDQQLTENSKNFLIIDLLIMACDLYISDFRRETKITSRKPQDSEENKLQNFKPKITPDITYIKRQSI